MAGGYSLIFYLEAPLILTSSAGCTYTSTQSDTLIILIIAGVLLLLSLILWVLITHAYSKHVNETEEAITPKKYTEIVRTNPTEADEKHKMDKNQHLMRKVEQTQ